RSSPLSLHDALPIYPGALAFARTLAREVVLRGGVVVSGGARGIDGAAHEAALDAGGATWVVAPTGADACSPKEHADLFAKVEARSEEHTSELQSREK